ncbi:AI-2E family transporter [Clostridium sp. DJ247]|nr:AI-2E family transporter [Clostridium sp. DJ247]
MIFIKNQLTDFNLNNYKGIIDNSIINLIKESDVSSHLSQSGAIILKWIMRVEKLGTDIFLSFVLSLFFLLEQDKIIDFGEKIEKSKIAYIYKYYKYLGIKFLSSFGKIMEVQAVISLINSVLASIVFYIIGFDEVLGLGFMLFILGLIPVAGIFIALIPLVIIAFKIGGITKVIYVLIILLVLHILEAYAIKPQLMSMSVKIPIFFIFVILIFSEHYMGIWGLIIGLPLFVFVLDILGISEL